MLIANILIMRIDTINCKKMKKIYCTKEFQFGKKHTITSISCFSGYMQYNYVIWWRQETRKKTDFIGLRSWKWISWAYGNFCCSLIPVKSPWRRIICRINISLHGILWYLESVLVKIDENIFIRWRSRSKIVRTISI